ncbi:MAG: DUF4349 domain-containing protein [Eubacteriales bacterium]|nr:DUF4349 domain-containing protein [Eubacteriales bacterium]
MKTKRNLLSIRSRITKRAVVALVLCTVLLFTFGCAARASESDVAYAPAPAGAAYDEAAPQAESAETYAVSSDASGSTGTQTEPTGDFDVRKIVYTADMTLTADDPEQALANLVESAQNLGGYVSGSYSTTDDLGTYYSTATIKVPADQLETLVNAAKSIGKVDDYRLSSDDISLSYYDMQARLDNAKAEEQQLLEILAQCKTIEEILAVRQSLTSVRADIESYTAQMNLWDNLVSYATLNLTINRTPKTAVAGEKELIQVWKASDTWGRMARGFQNSARFVVNALGAIGIFLAVAIIPAGILFLAIGLPIILHKKNKRKKAAALKAQQPAAAEPENTIKQNE